jgi:hypothetical protein
MKHSNGPEIIAVIEQLRQKALEAGDPAMLKTVEHNLAYFKERRAMLRYAHFRELGYPIGSGATESANKVGVEARLKGAGMHWAEEQLNPMLALRNLSCNERWEGEWPLWEKAWQSQIQQRKTEQATKRRQNRANKVSPDEPTGVIRVTLAAATVGTLPQTSPQVLDQAQKPAVTVATAPSKPGPNHPWHRMKIGQALYVPNPDFVNAKN